MTTTTTPSPSPSPSSSSSSSSSSSTTPTTSSSSSSTTPKITVAQLPKIVLARLIDRFLVSDSLLPVLGLVIVTHFVAAWLPLWLAIPALAGLLYGVFTIEKWRLNKLTTHRLEDLDQLFEIGNKENIHHETALWINFLLHKVLQNYGSLFNNLIKEKTNEALKNVKVPVIDGISLAKFDLGKRPPLLSDLASFDFAPNKLSFEVVIHYMSDLELEVQVLKKTFVVPITFSDFFLRIRSRINLELVPNAPPFINVASLQLLDIPTVDFSLKLFHLLDLIEIPVPFVGASYVQAIVNTVSRILLVNPTKIEVSIDELLFNSLPEMFKQQFDVSEILKKRQEKLERKDKKGNILEGGLSTVGAGVNLVGHSVLAVGEGVGEGVATVGKGVFAVGEGVGHGVFNVGKGVGKGVTAVGGGVGKLGKSLLGKKKENVEEASPTTPSSATEASQQPTVATETEGNK